MAAINFTVSDFLEILSWNTLGANIVSNHPIATAMKGWIAPMTLTSATGPREKA